MTVRELIEKLEQFPESYVVLIPNASWNPDGHTPSHVPVTNVAIGCNEFDACVFLDDYVEDNGCVGCVYEDADGSTTAISNCVCCSRNVDYAKNDYYKKRS